MAKRKRHRTAVPAPDRRYLTELERLVAPPELNAFLMRQMQAEGDRWWRLASRYSHDDHKPRRTTLAVMAVECGLSYTEIAAAWIRESQVNALLNAAGHVGPVLKDIAADSLNREEVCPKCEGATVIYKDGEERKCTRCRGTGAILKRGDKDAREQFLKVNKLIDQPGKGAGVSVQVNNALPSAPVPSLAQVMEEARKALGSGQATPLLAESSEVTSDEG